MSYIVEVFFITHTMCVCVHVRHEQRKCCLQQQLLKTPMCVLVHFIHAGEICIYCYDFSVVLVANSGVD